ncbi:ABC transporter ATP-binding protein [Actinomadura chibensis]|uniref:ABC transporter ATP-binding protein n=1 Tax=Actinomadura chibensis TaxID=392828 RepID=UPI001FE3A035|nr:ABC transporter ATP-binding protein [Actinomadura chibensis]
MNESAAAAPGDRFLDPAVKIQIDHVSKAFPLRSGEVVALDDINLTIRRGEFLAIVGPSGCGKTSLLRILGGLEKHDQGEIRVRRYDRSRPENTIVFQQESIFPWMTIRQNVGYGLKIRKASKDVVRAQTDKYLEMTGLQQFAAAYPHQLSGGMKQRVAVARAFANDPEVLLMDEPFAALDEQTKAMLQQELLRIWDTTKKTVLFITHSVDEAVVLADRIIVMSARPGRIKKDIPVPFARPRDVLGLRYLPEYGELVGEIWDSLKDELPNEQRGR